MYFKSVLVKGKRSCVIVVTYVDDLLLMGVNQILGLMDALREAIEMDPPHPIANYLGAVHQMVTNGAVTTIAWDMSNYLTSACRRFEKETGIKLKPATTPYSPALPKDQLDLKLAAPGELGFCAASMLMGLLYPGRMAFPVVVLAIQRLAKRVTKWCAECDRRLTRLFEFVLYASHFVLTGELSHADAADIELPVYPDGDLCGNFWDTKSTAGLWCELSGRDGRSWPLSWQSKAEPATAAHTQEAEMVSLSMAVRNEATPLQQLLSALLGRPVLCRVFEDNTACITAAEKGYSPSLRHLARHQRCALGTVHETFFEDADATPMEAEARRRIICEYGEMRLEHKDTKQHKGDFFTKELPRVEFDNACQMMKIRTPKSPFLARLTNKEAD